MNQYSVWAREAEVPSLSAKVVLLVLASHANENNRYFPGQPAAYPSLALLERECRLSRPGLLKALRKLHNHLHVEKVDSFNGPRNAYILKIAGALPMAEPAPEEAAAEPETAVVGLTELTPQEEPPVNWVNPYPSTELTPTGEPGSPQPVNGVNPKVNKKEKEKGKKKEKDGDECAPKKSAKAKSGKTVDKDLSKVVLPEWMPADVWGRWVQYRSDLKKEMTVSIAEEQIRLLGRAMENGHSPVDLISIAIASKYQGCVFQQHLKSNGHESRASRAKPVDPNNPLGLGPIELEQYRMAEYLRKQGRDPASVFGALSGFSGAFAGALGGEPEKDITAIAGRVA